jgi:hypothetical protein
VPGREPGGKADPALLEHVDDHLQSRPRAATSLRGTSSVHLA